MDLLNVAALVCSAGSAAFALWVHHEGCKDREWYRQRDQRIREIAEQWKAEQAEIARLSVSKTAVQCTLSELAASGVDPLVIREATVGSGLRDELRDVSGYSVEVLRRLDEAEGR